MPAVLVTGAGRGIGLATAKAFAQAGWKVFALDKAFPGEVVGERVEYDLTDLAGIPKLIGRLGEVETPVNNAGVLYCEPYDAIPEAHAAEILTVNLRAPAACGATKAALLNIIKSYAGQLGREGILVNAVSPGPTLTAMYEQLPQSRKDGVMRSVHAGRPCMPQEVAQAILWLGSASPDYVSGTTLDVNSGSYPR